MSKLTPNKIATNGLLLTDVIATQEFTNHNVLQYLVDAWTNDFEMLKTFLHRHPLLADKPCADSNGYDVIDDADSKQMRPIMFCLMNYNYVMREKKSLANDVRLNKIAQSIELLCSMEGVNRKRKEYCDYVHREIRPFAESNNLILHANVKAFDTTWSVKGPLLLLLLVLLMLLVQLRTYWI